MSTDQATLKKQILEFSRNEEHDNKRCVDCASPHPQWASANNAVFMCIQCAGVHRGLGVHVSFVRSVTMDTWKPDEVAKMKLGGNKEFKEFMKSYTLPSSDSFSWTYDESMHSKASELYNSWPAVQYREKLAADMEGKPWSPSAPSPEFKMSQSGSSQSLRTRSQIRTAPAQSSHRSSPVLRSDSPQNSSPYSDNASSSFTLTADQKAQNENFFANLGAANAQRPDHLPPSQGGRYSGFGSSPSPPPFEAMALSSKALPSFQDMQSDPGAALSKGWSLLSSALSGASKAVNESIIQPGMQTVRENAPGVQAKMGEFARDAQRGMTVLGGAVKEKTGVDVAEGWGTLVDKVKAINVGGSGNYHERNGYRGVNDGWNEHEEEGSALYRDDDADGDDFFKQYEEKQKAKSSNNAGASGSSAAQSNTAPKPKEAELIEKDGWDDWKDF